MSSFRFIEIDGKRYLWRDILALRRAQRAAFIKAQQPLLFEPKHDCRPEAQRSAAGRYQEPSLFDEPSTLNSTSERPKRGRDERSAQAS